MEVVEFKLNTKPTTADEMTASLEAVRSELTQLSTLKTVNVEALTKAAADLEEMKESLQAAVQSAAKAEEVAKAHARTVPASVSESELKLIPQPYEVDPDYVGKMSRGHFNLMMLPKAILATLPDGVSRMVGRFRDLHDQCAIIHAYMLGSGSLRAHAYAEAGGMKSLRSYKQYLETERVLRAAMDTAEVGAGTEWVPTGVGVSLIEDIRPSLELVGYIPTIPMPRNPYVYPVQGVHFKTYLVPEATADSGNTAIGKRNLQTFNLTFSAKKHAAMLLASTEMDEDSIVPLIPAIRADFVFAVAAGLEDTWWNGQISGGIAGQFDTGSVPGASDVRASWDGIRAAAEATGLTVDGSAGLIVERLTQLKGKLGKFGKNPAEGVWGTGYAGWAKLLTLKDSSGTSVLLTQEKMGAGATLPTGTLGMVLGSPLVVGDDYPENMNVAGIIDGVQTDQTAIHYFNRRCFRHGEVRLALIEASRDWAFDVDQLAFRVTYRSSGKPVRTPNSTTWRAAGKISGIPVA